MFGGIFDTILSIVNGWKPQQAYSGEEGYRNELVKLLRSELSKPNLFGSSQHSVEKESGRNLADIGIDRSVGVELKYNLRQKKEVNRLVGQVNDFLKDYKEGVIVVLCGKTDEDQIDHLRSSLNDILGKSYGIFEQKRIKLVVKTYTPQEQPPSLF